MLPIIFSLPYDYYKFAYFVVSSTNYLHSQLTNYVLLFYLFRPCDIINLNSHILSSFLLNKYYYYFSAFHYNFTKFTYCGIFFICYSLTPFLNTFITYNYFPLKFFTVISVFIVLPFIINLNLRIPLISINYYQLINCPYLEFIFSKLFIVI